MAGPAQTVWYLRERLDERTGRWQVRGIVSPAFGDGTVVERGDLAPEAVPPDRATLWSTSIDHHDRSVLWVTEAAVPGAPALWFVAIPQRDLDPAQHDLVAFASDVLPPGTVVDNITFAAMPVASAEQVAAVRWSPATAVVDQIFVAAEHRRSNLGTKLLYAASAYHQSMGWPGKLHSDGRRTDLGQRFTAGLRHPDRIAPWTDHAHPMDPDRTA
ncbi:MAG: hypothetical protein JJT89_00125 [Nitriliruptoraceae bacterium]|nr:hypothetical protein [Nitriliruptoraceae bacterium]